MSIQTQRVETVYVAPDERDERRLFNEETFNGDPVRRIGGPLFDLKAARRPAVVR
jgi:hypothetical protein